MRAPKSNRCRYSSRPFILSTLIITLLTTYSLFLRQPGSSSSHDPSRLRARETLSKPECREVHYATDQCAFIIANCGDDEAGLIHYLSFYYCTLGNAKPVAFIILVTWLGLLFTTIGIAASDFFSVNLSTIAAVLGLSESLAGVTFLAFGNGSPDVFSTFAAMGSNSGSMAVGELIGAAGFISAVVAGSMALVREFRVSRKTFVRDIVFFIVSVSFSMVFLADGELHLWECLSMIAFYLFYVVIVVGWHWWTTRQKRKRLRDVASRGHFNLAASHASDDLEPYRDDEDDDDEPPPVGGRSASVPEAADLSALERAAPRIEVDGIDAMPPPSPDDDEVERQVAAEMTSSMRVMRPRWGRSNTTITAIRPSLVGALEFRYVLASLQKARNMKLTPLPERPYSDNQTPIAGDPADPTIAPSASSVTRERALSSGNIPLNLVNEGLPEAGAGSSSRPRGESLGADRWLAPPSRPSDILQSPQSPRTGGLQLQIPSPSLGSSGHSSPALSPFPMLSESPAEYMNTAQGHHPSAFVLPSPADRRVSIPGFDEPDANPKPVKWWPYKFLPAPHIIYGTLFPTLQGWREKSVWDKIVSLISVPSILALVITLPVVETERDDEDSEVTLAEPLTPGSPGHTAPAVSVEHHAQISPETAWQEYRRRTRSNTSRTISTMSLSPVLIAVDSSHATESSASTNGARASFPFGQPVKTGPEMAIDPSVTSDQDDLGWSRWLVALQIFTGPLFVVFILWANMQEDMENPTKTLVRMILYSLIVSLCLLSLLLLTTTPDRKPKYHFFLCFLGFVISVAWISTVAGEVVGVLKTFGVILGISEAILGLTIFAVGNSLGDLVADVTVARLGYPVMALAACFGGPMLNILLGVGIGGAWMGISAANEEHKKHPELPLVYQPYRIQVGGTLMISAITVLLTLIVLLIVVPSNQWIMSRKIGWGLIGIWTVGTVVNLTLELTGAWSDVS